MVEERRADEEALLMPLEREAAAVDDELGAPVAACLDPAFDPRLLCGRDDGAVMRLGIGRYANAQRPCGGTELLTEADHGVTPDGLDARQTQDLTSTRLNSRHKSTSRMLSSDSTNK